MRGAGPEAGRAPAGGFDYPEPAGPSQVSAFQASDGILCGRVTAIVDTPEEADALDRPPLLVLRPLEARLDAHGLGSGPIEAEPIGDGHSNVTYLVRRGDDELVLRRPPRPPLPPVRPRRAARGAAADGARARRRAHPARPARLRRRVGDRRAVLRHGAHRGRRDHERAAGAARRRDERRRIGDELVDALAEIHAVDWQACGLEGYGKPTGYLERQLRRFGGLWEHNKTRELPVLDDLAAGWPSTGRSRARPRSCTATTGSATRSSPPAGPARLARSSTGSSPRSATRSPTSAT